jgi:multiple sugar transport system permease protein
LGKVRSVQRRGDHGGGGDKDLRRARWIFLAPLSLILGLLTLPPFFYALFLSLTDSSPTSGATKFVGLGNYLELFTSAQFWAAARVTAIFAGGAVAIELALGLAVALLLTNVRSGATGTILRSLFLLPMAATPVAVLFGWRVMLNPTQGIINYGLGELGLPQPDWLGSAASAVAALVIIDVWQWTPFVMVIMVGALASLPAEHLEAAAVDGASAWQRFRYVVLPFLRPYIVVAVLFRGIDALKEFDKFEVLTGGGPGDATTTLNMLAYRTSIQFLDFGKGAAVAMLLLIFAIVFGRLVLGFLAEREQAA